MQRAPLLALAALLGCAPVQAQSPSDESAVRKVLSDLMDNFNQHDGRAMAKDYASDLDHVNVMGQWTRGKEAMEKVYIREHAPGGRFTGAGTRTAQVQQVKFVRPDVAIAITESSDQRNRLRSTYVLTREGSRWLIRNMTVSPIRDPAPSAK